MKGPSKVSPVLSPELANPRKGGPFRASKALRCQSIRKQKMKVMIIQLDSSHYQGVRRNECCVLLQSRNVGWEDGGQKRSRKVGSPAWGHTAAAVGQVTCPELGVKTTAWDRRILVQEMLH